jgi:membrane protein required for colicin V production
MEFNYFDLVAASIILLLGLKGVLNGFFKEVFGLIGIIGGIFIASRAGDSVGQYLNDIIFKFDSQSAISFTGFLATLAIFWIIMIALGYAFKKLTDLSGLGIFDKILGFVFGASKFFLIAAVIAYAVYNIKSLRPTLDSALKNSVLFPVMVEAGAFIMKIDPANVSDKINDTIDQGTEMINEKTQDVIDDSIKTQVDEIKKKIAEDS